MRFLAFFLCILSSIVAYSQNIQELEQQKIDLQKKLDKLNVKLGDLKLLQIQQNLSGMGWPSEDEVITHAAMALAYSEEHEQAKWVSHVIIQDVKSGRTSRTNDFRQDPKVSTGSAVEEDYFLKYLQEDGSYIYDGFGYDRGHLAPSADFRWNQTALSESYFYSNMSPQLPDFNRGKWADLEDMIRGYIYANDVKLYVVTGPVLQPNLSVVERGLNKVSIPKQYYKVVLDSINKVGIGFLMPNRSIKHPVEYFAVSIDSVEKVSGLDFFPNLEDGYENEVEAISDYQPWLPEAEKGDVKPLYQPSLGRNQFNTVLAADQIRSKKTVEICGTVVSVFKSGKGNVFINLDKKFPNQIFSVSIWKSNLINFSYDPSELMGRVICVKGKVTSYQGVAGMSLVDEKKLTFLDKE